MLADVNDKDSHYAVFQAAKNTVITNAVTPEFAQIPL